MTIVDHLSADTLGKKIRTLRRKQKLTQQGLAEGLVTPSMISQIESDRATPSATLLGQLAMRLGVDMHFFEEDLIDKSDELQNYRAARNLMNTGRYEEAMAWLKTLSWPLSPQFKPEVVYNEIANCHIHLGDYDSAVRVYEELIQVGYERNDFATVVHAYYHVGIALRRVSRHRVARMYWQRAVDLLAQHVDGYMPITLKIHANLGRQYLQEQNWSASRASYMEALELYHQFHGSLDLAKTYHGLACACMHLNQIEQALEYNDAAVETHVKAENHKGAMRCRLNRGVILRFAKRYDEAQVYFHTLRSLVSDRDEILLLAILHETALVAFDIGDHDTALKESDAALNRLKVDPYVEADLRLMRARIYFETHHFELAMKEIERGRRKIEDDSLISLHVGFNEVERQCWMKIGREADILSSCTEKAASIIATATVHSTDHISA